MNIRSSLQRDNPFQRAECAEKDHHAVATLGYIRATHLLQRIRHGPREAAEYGRTAVELKAVPLEGVSAAPRDAVALAHCYVQSVLKARFAKNDEPPGITSKNLTGQAGCILFLPIPLLITHSQSLKGVHGHEDTPIVGARQERTNKSPKKTKAAAHIQGKPLEVYLDMGAADG